MQQTTNYNLLIPEGTDIVNPLTQVNPNFQTIDGAMFANKQSSIGTATEVVTGTVHAIVRSNTDSDVFRFTATGAWTAGDSMTVDGVGVTVHLSDGTAPVTGSYIIGAEVLAMINGTLVTLAISTTPPAQGVTSFNGRTGAVVPMTSDYDASMVDYDNTGSGLTSTEVQSAIDEIEQQILNFSGSIKPDYANAVNLVSSMNVQGATYNVPSDGIMQIQAINMTNGDGYAVVRQAAPSSIVLAYARDETQYAGTLTTCFVNAGSTIELAQLSNKTISTFNFIPYL